MKTIKTLTLVLALICSSNALAKDKFSVCWSIYVGWMPWEYGDSSGIVKKWADKYDIEIDVVQIVSITLLSLLLCVLASIYPARKAMKIAPSQALQNE